MKEKPLLTHVKTFLLQNFLFANASRDIAAQMMRGTKEAAPTLLNKALW